MYYNGKIPLINRLKNYNRSTAVLKIEIPQCGINSFISRIEYKNAVSLAHKWSYIAKALKIRLGFNLHAPAGIVLL